MLGLGGVLPAERVERVIKTIDTHHVSDGGLRMLSWPGGRPETFSKDWPVDSRVYSVVPYACVRFHRESFQSAYEAVGPLLRNCLADEPTSKAAAGKHLGRLALWYLLVASPVVQIRLAEKRLELRPDHRHNGEGQEHTLITPRGFGRVHLQCTEESPFSLRVRFEMDIPVELTSVRIYLDQDPGSVQGEFELAEGTVPLRVESTCTDRSGIIVDVFPAVKTPVSGFELRLHAREAGTESSASKKRWFPRWIQRGGAG